MQSSCQSMRVTACCTSRTSLRAHVCTPVIVQHRHFTRIDTACASVRAAAGGTQRQAAMTPLGPAAAAARALHICPICAPGRTACNAPPAPAPRWRAAASFAAPSDPRLRPSPPPPDASSHHCARDRSFPGLRVLSPHWLTTACRVRRLPPPPPPQRAQHAWARYNRCRSRPSALWLLGHAGRRGAQPLSGPARGAEGAGGWDPLPRGVGGLRTRGTQSAHRRGTGERSKEKRKEKDTRRKSKTKGAEATQEARHTLPAAAAGLQLRRRCDRRRAGARALSAAARGLTPPGSPQS
jgi:hypothetical protein